MLSKRLARGLIFALCLLSPLTMIPAFKALGMIQILRHQATTTQPCYGYASCSTTNSTTISSTSSTPVGATTSTHTTVRTTTTTTTTFNFLIYLVVLSASRPVHWFRLARLFCTLKEAVFQLMSAHNPGFWLTRAVTS